MRKEIQVLRVKIQSGQLIIVDRRQPLKGKAQEWMQFKVRQDREAAEGCKARESEPPVFAISTQTGSAGEVRLSGSLTLPAIAHFSRSLRLVQLVAL